MKGKLLYFFIFFLIMAGTAYASLLDLNIAYCSKYIWRGYDLNAGQPAVQPGATVYLGNTGLSLGLWASCNAGDPYASTTAGGIVNREVTEIDYTATYASFIGDDWNYSVYYSYYTYPVAPEGRTGELFLSLTGNNLPLTPTMIASYDHDKGKGAYLSLSGKRSFPAGSLPVDVSLAVGYDCGQFGVKAGPSDATATVSSVISTGNMNLTPSFNYTIVNHESRPLDGNLFWFALAAASKNTNM
ncbi:MAG TPA: TorF family putative porin [Candidatus Omnitrophota bacterium]|nr:TorF family putative porin [Candidatus Omnitrophota bacterium]